MTTISIDTDGTSYVMEQAIQGGEVIMDSIQVTKEVAECMKSIPRKFNETLTDWAIRCQAIRNVKGINAEPTS